LSEEAPAIVELGAARPAKGAPMTFPLLAAENPGETGGVHTSCASDPVYDAGKATEGHAMAQAMEDTLAVPDKRAAQLAAISMKQLRHWEKTGLVVPSIRQQISQRNTVRLYSFQDLLQLLVVAELRHRLTSR
jgi:MerR-like DNA binding protein